MRAAAQWLTDATRALPILLSHSICSDVGTPRADTLAAAASPAALSLAIIASRSACVSTCTAVAL